MLLRIGLLLFLNFVQTICQSYNDVFCRRPWYFNSPRPAPLRCPTPSFFSYYECCGEFRENCCWRLRPEPIWILTICFILLLIICCCCCLGFLFMGGKNKKKNQQIVPKDEEIPTVAQKIDSGTQSDRELPNGPFEKRRSYAVATMDRDVDYQYFH